MEEINKAWGSPLSGGMYMRQLDWRTVAYLQWRDYKAEDSWWLSVYERGGVVVLPATCMTLVPLQWAMRRAEEKLIELGYSDLELPKEYIG